MLKPTQRKAPPNYGWVQLTRAEAKAFSKESKAKIKQDVDAIIETSMKPRYIKPKSRRKSFGEVYDLYTKWHGHSLALIARRRGGRSYAAKIVDDFETKSGRLTILGPNRYAVSYFRHTGRWWTLSYNCTWKHALDYFRKPSPVWPW